MSHTVDAWAQMPTERMLTEPWLEPLLRWTRQTGEALEATSDATVAAMDAAGVELALLSAWYGPTGSLISNEEVAAQVESAPTRFRGLAGVDLRRPMDAVRAIRDVATDERFVGVRIVPWLWELPPDHRSYYPVYTACVDAGFPICTQIGHTGPLRTSETGRLIPYLERVMLDFPELVVVGGHVGAPWIDEVHTMTAKFPNFYVDTSAYAVHRLPPAFVQHLHGIGRHRVMFGTNWPMLSPQRCLAGLGELGLDADGETAFLGGTAREVFGLN